MLKAEKTTDGKYSMRILNPGKETAFFIRLKVVNEKKGELVLPVFFNRNYFTLLPGEEKDVNLDLSQHVGQIDTMQVKLVAEGWNVPEQKVDLPW
jgi:exo-1,4-beta-D-glucosaminidase